MLYMIFLVVVFSFYTFFESLSGIARFAGSKIGAISLGLSLQNQVLSLNRFLGFLIAPMVGFFADTKGSIEGIALIGVVGSLIGATTLVFGYRSWNIVALFFAVIARIFVTSGYNVLNLFRADWALLSSKLKGDYFEGSIKKKFHFDYFAAQFVTTGLAMPAVFAINIFALKYDTYSATILQLTTVISGLGNLLLNFYTYPKLSVTEARDVKMAENCYRSIYLGKITGLGFFAPLIIAIAYYL